MYNPNTTDNQQEMYDVVDEMDQVIGKATRKEVHSNKVLIHRAAGGYIFNTKKQVLMQKRSKTKDMFPGHWAFSVGGHVDSGDTYEKALQRELKEELGIQIPMHFVEKRLVRHEAETEFWSIYFGIHDGPFPDYNTIEIEEVRFFSLSDLEAVITLKKEPIVPEVVKMFPDVVSLVNSDIVKQLYPNLE